MFEPIVGERQCTCCLKCKPVTEFSVSRNKASGERPHPHCKECRNERARALRVETAGTRIKRSVRRKEIWPRKLSEALADVRLGRWRYPVEAGALAWRLA